MPLETLAASSWNPTDLVRTESFETIDAGDGTTNVELRFGASTNFIKFLTSNKFQFSHGFSVLGHMSGSSLNVDRNATVGGTFTATGSILTRGALSGATFFQSGFSTCTTDKKVTYDLSTGKFGCADSTGGSGNWSNTGSVMNAFDFRYVKKSGDTMTGALTINLSSGFLGLKLTNTMSGNVIHAEKTLTSSGQLIVTGSGLIKAGSASMKPLTVRGAASQSANLAEWQNSAGTALVKIDSNGQATFNASGNGTKAVFKGGASDTNPIVEFQNSAGAVLAGVGAAGNANVPGATSDFRVGISGAGTTGNGFQLVEQTTGSKRALSWGINNNAAFAMAYNAAVFAYDNGTFFKVRSDMQIGFNSTTDVTSTATSDVGLARIAASQMRLTNGGTGNGQLLIGPSTTTIGAQLHVVAGSSSTKGLIVQGAASQSANLQEWQNSAGTALSLITPSGSGSFTSIAIGKTPVNGRPFEVFGTMSGTSLWVNGSSSTPMLMTQQTTARVGIGTSAPKAKLDVVGTVSGASIHASTELRSSGSLIVEGTMSGATLEGADLRDCQGSINKLTYDATKKKFGCDIDQATGTGLSIPTGDQRYVKKAGGTMTGALTVNLSSGQLGIDVKQTLSGNTLRVTKNADVIGVLAVSGAVRTDSNLTINDDADSNDAVLTFGNASANGTLTLVNALQKFQFSKTLSVLGTISGSALNVDRNATVGGTFTASGYSIFKNGLSGANLVVSGASSFSGTILARTNITSKGTLSGASLTVTGLKNCANLQTGVNGTVTCGQGPDTATFTNSTRITWTDNNTTELWSGTRPSITPTSTSQTILVSVNVGIISTSGNDTEIDVAQVYRTTDGSNPTCNSSTKVGPTAAGGFTSANTQSGSLMLTFLDTPATTNQVTYTICTDAGSVATSVANTAVKEVFTLAVLGADVAENYYTKDTSIGPGDVVSIDPSLPAGVKKSDQPLDPHVLGIVSTQPKYVLDDRIGTEFGRPVPVGLVGRVPVKVTLEGGEIRAGDLLTSSGTPGYAMRANGPGPVICQALTDFVGPGPRGMALCFINAFRRGDEGQEKTIDLLERRIEQLEVRLDSSAPYGPRKAPAQSQVRLNGKKGMSSGKRVHGGESG